MLVQLYENKNIFDRELVESRFDREPVLFDRESVESLQCHVKSEFRGIVNCYTGRFRDDVYFDPIFMTFIDILVYRSS